MSSINLQFVICCVLLIILTSFCDYIRGNILLDVTETNFSPDFAYYTLVKPRLYHAREKREILTTKENNGNHHIHDLNIALKLNGKEHLLKLKLNKELIPKGYFHRYQHKGKPIVKKPKIHEIELCEYQGTLSGVENSWAAISTCDNKLSGVIFDGNELHYIESTRKSNNSKNDLDNFNDHYLYKYSDLIEKQKCGNEESNISFFNTSPSDAIHRYKRSNQNTDIIRGPYNANETSRFVELVLVVDKTGYERQGSELQMVTNRAKNIANIINVLYSPLNIFIALVGVVVWTERDEIDISENGDTTLTHFLRYRREQLAVKYPNDNAQLLIGTKFKGAVVGKSLKGPICTFEFSGGVSTDVWSTVGLIATTVAHQMGHNFGMEHDTIECNCPDERCIMSASFSSISPKHWSSCSLKYLENAFEHGMDYCLRNKPEHLFDSPVCGNGFVETGEQCDCGFVDNCKNPCCNATTCMLHSNASCATGECCDLLTCRPKIAGTLCRTADHECDLPEYCTGQSEYCPNDVYKMDSETCNEGQAFCYQGSCRTHNDQCKILWGPSAATSQVECYKLNTRGTRHGNCGYNLLNSSYIKCKDEDSFCGLVHCEHSNDKLEFGMESVSIFAHTFIKKNGSFIKCNNVMVDLGLNDINPGLTPNGAMCGKEKMCINQRCVAIEDLRKGVNCSDKCNGNGFCNNKGHCHCKDGFAPPNCEYTGVGGSVDSGPIRHIDASIHVNRTLPVEMEKITPIDEAEKPISNIQTSINDLQVIFKSNRTDGTIKAHEVNILKKLIVEKMLRTMEDSTSSEYHFRNASFIHPGWFLIMPNDMISRDWLLTENQTYVIDGILFSATKPADQPEYKPRLYTISFWLRSEEIDIDRVTKFLRLQNRQMNINSWQFLRKEGKPGMWQLFFQVDKKEIENLESNEWWVFYELMTLKIENVDRNVVG